MHPRTREIKRTLNRLETYEEKIASIEGIFNGEDVFLLAPGPSLGEIDKTTLSEKLKGRLTFSIKQAYLEYKKETDFHFINDCNLPKSTGYAGYLYGVKSGPISIASSGYPEEHARTRFAPCQPWDVFCRVLDPLVYPKDNLGRLCEHHRFEEGLFTKTIDRPCGPSITIETVIYMAVHVGAKNIYAIGWDSGATTVGKHFYTEKTHLESNREFEYELVQKGSGPLYNWLKQQDVNLHLISDISALDKQIPRIKLEDIK